MRLAVLAPRHRDRLFRLRAGLSVPRLHRVSASRQIQKVVEAIEPRHALPGRAGRDSSLKRLGHADDRDFGPGDRSLVLAEDATGKGHLMARALPVGPRLHAPAPCSSRSLMTLSVTRRTSSGTATSTDSVT